MAGFDVYPGVDSTYNFPSVIRAAAAATPEMNARFTTVQGSLDTITNNRQHYNYRWANLAARTAQTGMRKFDTGTQLDTGQRYEYTGTEWLIRFSSLPILTTAERTALLDKVNPGTMVLDIYGQSYRWTRNRVSGTPLPDQGNAPTGTPSYSWLPWDSDWYNTIPTFGGLTGGAYATPGWVPGGMYRYVAGNVLFHFGFNLNSAMTPGNITCALPVPAHQFGLFNSGSGESGQNGLATRGRAWRRGSRWYDYAIQIQNSTTIGFMNVNGAQYMDGQGGGAWTQSEVLNGVIEYEPA